MQLNFWRLLSLLIGLTITGCNSEPAKGPFPWLLSGERIRSEFGPFRPTLSLEGRVSIGLRDGKLKKDLSFSIFPPSRARSWEELKTIASRGQSVVVTDITYVVADDCFVSSGLDTLCPLQADAEMHLFGIKWNENRNASGTAAFPPPIDLIQERRGDLLILKDGGLFWTTSTNGVLAAVVCHAGSHYDCRSVVPFAPSMSYTAQFYTRSVPTPEARQSMSDKFLEVARSILAPG